MNMFHIRVERISDEPEYAIYSFYNVQAPNRYDAGVKARKQFNEDFGTPFEKTRVGYVWEGERYINKRLPII